MRLNWEQYKLFRRQKNFVCASTVERSSGLIANFPTKFELYVALANRPTPLALIAESVEVWEGLPVVAVDAHAADRIAKKIKNGVFEDTFVYTDKHGGIVCHGRKSNVNIEEAEKCKAFFLEVKKQIEESQNENRENVSSTDDGGAGEQVVSGSAEPVNALPNDGSAS